MGKPILGVDVDICVCPSDKGWWKFLYEQSAIQGLIPYFDQCTAEVPYHYNLSDYYENKDKCFDYWRELDYSQFEPLEGSVEALKALSEYFDIVFISRIKGFHTKSKYYWLKEHFPFMTEYVATHGKWVMSGSIVAMIDDRLDVLEPFPLEKRVWFKTNYTQSAPCNVSHSFESWDNELVECLCKRYLRGLDEKVLH